MMDVATRRDGLPRGIGLGLLLALAAAVGVGILLIRMAGPVAPPPPPLGTVGSVGRIERGALWVDPAGLAVWERAYANRDERGMQAAVTLYEGLLIATPTRARVIARQDALIQVELLDGEHAGRRGWGRASLLAP